jgi:DNA-binding Lrp family transcriptional regulator
MELDQLDLDIIDELNLSSKSDLVTIGKKLGVSHGTIKYRIDKMLEHDMIRRNYGINLSKIKLGLYNFMLNVSDKEKYLETLTKCTRFFGYFDTIGEYNLVIQILAEDILTIESISNNCSLYNDKRITKKTIVPMMNFSRRYIYVNLNFKKRKKSCGNDCKSCHAYKSSVCKGCIDL